MLLFLELHGRRRLSATCLPVVLIVHAADRVEVAMFSLGTVEELNGRHARDRKGSRTGSTNATLP